MQKWKKIDRFDGKYSISDSGEVRNDSTGKMLKQSIHVNGYCVVGIYNKEKKQTSHYRVHRLVAEAFIPNPDNKEIVNHIDGNKHNNSVENLEWNTSSENVNHAFKTGLSITTKNQRDSARKNIEKNRLLSNCNRKEIYSINSEGIKIIYKSVVDASKIVGVGSAAIVNCLKGKTKTAAKMKWGYC